MDEREIKERIQYFQDIASRHGYQSVPAAMVYQAFEDLVQPASFGFRDIRKGLYGRIVNEDIVHIMKLQAMKGRSYTVRWGVSLTYFPHEWRSGLRWHRSFKSSRFDLFELPGDSSSDWRENDKDQVHTLNGKPYLLETLQIMWNRLEPRIDNWFSSIRSLHGVLERAIEQSERKWVLSHHPSPELVYAITLSRMGRQEEALAALNRYFDLRRETQEAQENLEKALHKARAA
jgi:hypothetical protein